MTAAQRRSINRQNAQNSTGPKSEEGKARSRSNALKHGLRAEVVALPNENVDEIQARSDSWNNHYQPRDPAERHLVDRAVAATLMADRCDRAQAARLAKQVRDAARAWDFDREDEVERLAALLEVEPALAVRQLKRTGHGCRWLLARWADLAEVFRVEGAWDRPRRALATRLTGHDPDLPKATVPVYLFRLYNHLLAANPDPGERAWLLEPANQPESLSGGDDGRLPEPAFCREALRTHMDEQGQELTALEARWRNAYDLADRAEAADRALIVDDPAARLLLRYQAEARTTFHRAYSALLKGRRDNPAEAPEAVSPNEPESADEPPSAPVATTTCDEAAAAVSEGPEDDFAMPAEWYEDEYAVEEAMALRDDTLGDGLGDGDGSRQGDRVCCQE